MNEIGNADMTRLISEMRALAARSGMEVNAADRPAGDAVAPTGETASFGEVMKSALETVNGLQQRSSSMAQAFERGDPGVDIAAVMVASQKSGLAFQAVTEVRNRLVRAYQDVMNMPV